MFSQKLQSHPEAFGSRTEGGGAGLDRRHCLTGTAAYEYEATDLSCLERCA
jgi:hypothetical protein